MRARFLPLVAASAAAVAWGPPSNVISTVEVKDAGAEVVLTIRAGEHPEFTSFSTTDPPGFVIDVSRSHFEGVPEELPGAGGIVGKVTARNYGDEDALLRIARVRLELTREVDPPVVDESGDAIVVRIAKPPAEPSADAPPAEPLTGEPAPASTGGGKSAE